MLPSYQIPHLPALATLSLCYNMGDCFHVYWNDFFWDCWCLFSSHNVRMLFFQVLCVILINHPKKKKHCFWTDPRYLYWILYSKVRLTIHLYQCHSSCPVNIQQCYNCQNVFCSDCKCLIKLYHCNKQPCQLCKPEHSLFSLPWYRYIRPHRKY